MWTSLVLAAGLGVVGLAGCSGSGGRDGALETLGQMSLPLSTQGASGTTYRLRDATFVVQPEYYYYDAAGAGGSPGTVTVSSETDPNAKNISLSLEEGYYNVQLLPGWHLEKGTAPGAQTVEATLLSGTSQWVYVSRQSTSWAEYNFGIGAKEIWLNGKLNIEINVQEVPGGEAGAGGGGPVGVATGGEGPVGVAGEAGL